MVNGNGSVSREGLAGQTAAGGLPAVFGHVDSGTVVPVLQRYLDAPAAGVDGRGPTNGKNHCWSVRILLLARGSVECSAAQLNP